MQSIYQGIYLFQFDVFALYKRYIDQFPKTVRTINKLCQTSTIFRKVLKKSHKDGGAIGNIRSLIAHLVQPIKRLSYYYTFIKVSRLVVISDL